MTLDRIALKLSGRLVPKYGKRCVLKRVAQGEYDPDTGRLHSSTLNHPVSAVMGKPNQQDIRNAQDVKLSEVATVSGAGLTFAPEVNDLFELDGRDYRVQAVTKTWSGEQVALWRLVLSG